MLKVRLYRILGQNTLYSRHLCQNWYGHMGHRHGMHFFNVMSLGEKTSIGGKSYLAPCRLELLYESDVL